MTKKYLKLSRPEFNLMQNTDLTADRGFIKIDVCSHEVIH